MNKPIVIYGSGAFAILLKKYIESDTDRIVAHFCVDEMYLDKNDESTIAFENIEKKCPPSKFDMIIAVGYRNIRNREKMFHRAKNKGYKLLNYIHSSVNSSPDFVHGENNIILMNVTIEPSVTIQDNNVIWSDTLLGHDAKIGSHNYISAKCLIAGNTEVGSKCFIGNSVSMINGLIIADESYLISGANLFKSTEECCTYIGTPATRIKRPPHTKHGIIIKR